MTLMLFCAVCAVLDKLLWRYNLSRLINCTYLHISFISIISTCTFNDFRHMNIMYQKWYSLNSYLFVYMYRFKNVNKKLFNRLSLSRILGVCGQWNKCVQNEYNLVNWKKKDEIYSFFFQIGRTPTWFKIKKVQSLGSCSHSIYLLVLKGFFIWPSRFDFISKKVGHVFFETAVTMLPKPKWL